MKTLTIFELFGQKEAKEFEIDEFDLKEDNKKLQKLIKDTYNLDTFISPDPDKHLPCVHMVSKDNKYVFLCLWGKGII